MEFIEVEVVEEDFNQFEAEVDGVVEEVPVQIFQLLNDVVAEVVDVVAAEDPLAVEEDPLAVDIDEGYVANEADEEVVQEQEAQSDVEENIANLAEGLTEEAVNVKAEWIFHYRYFQIPMSLVRHGNKKAVFKRLCAIKKFYDARSEHVLIIVRHFAFRLYDLLCTLERYNKKFISKHISLNNSYKDYFKKAFDDIRNEAKAEVSFEEFLYIFSHSDSAYGRINQLFYVVRFFYKNLKMHYRRRYMEKFGVDKKSIPKIESFYELSFSRTGARTDHGIC